MMCFSDIVNNLSYLGKVPSFLLDKEERRIIRISFAELESYMILIPDSLEKPVLTDDNVEHLPFTNTGNQLIYLNETEGLKEKLSLV